MEVRSVGFSHGETLAIEGSGVECRTIVDTWNEPIQRQHLMEFLSLIEREPSIKGASAHLMAVDRRSA